MCGRFTLGASASELIQQFGLTGLPAWTPRYNIAPTQEVLVVHQFTPDARREGSLFR
ncbi:MAG TPA: SOS response-associated peptidase family protein [Candidatus Methylomirabilis sp.]|nr:SOS response-associated peptidase family protein [Candidatus Methylomirabilis sp.]